jgi:hypothetical protein
MSRLLVFLAPGAVVSSASLHMIAGLASSALVQDSGCLIKPVAASSVVHCG